jgi:hypothetical protein
MRTREEMITRRVILADGRYLIYYTFGPAATPSPSQTAPASREPEAEKRDEET